MLPNNDEELERGMREATNVQTYLEMIGLYVLVFQQGFTQKKIHAISDAVSDYSDRTSRRVNQHLSELSSGFGQNLSAPDA